jgi:hypothetical protein
MCTPIFKNPIVDDLSQAKNFVEFESILKKESVSQHQ